MATVSKTAKCAGCPMARLYPDSNFVPARLGKGLRLMIAEAPGQQEALEMQPLVGTSGRWLRGGMDPETGRHHGGLLKQANIRDEDVTYGNCLSCRPPANVFPTDGEARSYISEAEAKQAVAHCFEAHVKPLLESRPWTRVDLLGDKALKIVAGKEGGITRWRGSPLSIPLLGPKIIAVPTLHPALIARDQSMIPAVVSDLKKNTVIPPEFYDCYPSLDVVEAWCFNTKVFAYDLETKWGTNEIICVGLCKERFKAIVVPFRGAYIPVLKKLFENAEMLVGHNLIQFDNPILFNALGLKDETTG